MYKVTQADIDAVKEQYAQEAKERWGNTDAYEEYSGKTKAYSKDKFDNEITFIFPIWMDEEELASYGPYHTVCRSKTLESIFIASLNNAEQDYKALIDIGWKPQQARAILPNALKTELVMTGFVSDWKHFFELRDAGSAHPQARELAQPLHQEFITRKYI